MSPKVVSRSREFLGAYEDPSTSHLPEHQRSLVGQYRLSYQTDTGRVRSTIVEVDWPNSLGPSPGVDLNTASEALNRRINEQLEPAQRHFEDADPFEIPKGGDSSAGIPGNRSDPGTASDQELDRLIERAERRVGACHRERERVVAAFHAEQARKGVIGVWRHAIPGVPDCSSLEAELGRLRED